MNAVQKAALVLSTCLATACQAPSPAVVAPSAAPSAAAQPALKIGQTLSYVVTFDGTPLDTTITAKEAQGAVVRYAVTVEGQAVPFEPTVDTAQPYFWINMHASKGKTDGSNDQDVRRGLFVATSTTQEAVTVPAGTFQATKTVGEYAYPIGTTGQIGKQAITLWTDAAVGMVKLVSAAPNTHMVELKALPK